MLQEFEWKLMSVMVRVENFKNLQNKALKNFGGDFLTFSSGQYPREKKSGNHHQSTQDTSNNKEEKVGKL